MKYNPGPDTFVGEMVADIGYLLTYLHREGLLECNFSNKDDDGKTIKWTISANIDQNHVNTLLYTRGLHNLKHIFYSRFEQSKKLPSGDDGDSSNRDSYVCEFSIVSRQD